MAAHALITPRRSPQPAGPISGRRRLGAGLLAVVVGTGITSGIAAGMSASALNLVTATPDAELLSLHAELVAAVAEVSTCNLNPEWSDEEVDRVSSRFSDACWAIVEAPCPQTPDGLALKAAAAMYQLQYSYSGAGWGGSGEAMAWDVLSQLAGDVYAPITQPHWMDASTEPART